MTNRRRSRWTIGHGMVLVAAVAVTLGVVLTPGFGGVLTGVVMLATAGAIVSLVVGRRVIELAYGHRCPRCHRRGLARRALLSFGERFSPVRPAG